MSGLLGTDRPFCLIRTVLGLYDEFTENHLWKWLHKNTVTQIHAIEINQKYLSKHASSLC